MDAGCFNGDSAVDYLRWMGNDAMDVVAFEADPINYERCRKRLSSYPNVNVCHTGLSDGQEELRFKGGGRSSSSFSSGEGDLMRTDTIDNILQSKPVSFIKMDIEGFEEKALQGASATIRRYKPALAISIYHKRDDILTIPKKILEFNEDYRFYLRHYFLGSNETVLYAVNE